MGGPHARTRSIPDAHVAPRVELRGPGESSGERRRCVGDVHLLAGVTVVEDVDQYGRVGRRNGSAMVCPGYGGAVDDPRYTLVFHVAGARRRVARCCQSLGSLRAAERPVEHAEDVVVQHAEQPKVAVLDRDPKMM